MARQYTDAEREWLETHWREMTNDELVAAFTALFGEIGPSSMRYYGKNRGWRKNPGVRDRALRRYTDEENDFLVGFIPGHGEREIADAFEERFGRRLTDAQIAGCKVRLGVKSGTHGGRFEKGGVPATKGRPWSEWMPPESQERVRAALFKPGNLPHNTRPLLDERTGEDGYVQVHVAQHRKERPNDQWVSKAEFVWEQANGMEWPEGCRAVFADRDKTNFDPENIVPVPMDLYPIVCGAVRGGMAYYDRASLDAAVMSARVTRARWRLEKRT